MAKKNTGINLDPSDEDHDIWAQQMGAKNWSDLIEKYKENPKFFTDNKYKIQGDDRYTPDMIINRLEMELSTQPGAKSAGGEHDTPESAGGEHATPKSTPDSVPGTEPEPTPGELTFPTLAAQLGIDPNNPTKEGQEKLKSWLEEHAGSYTPGEKTNAYLNAEPKDDTKGEDNAKKQYNKAMMSIWDAYRNGEISKETAGYFTIDAIATLAKNLGRSIGNVGAQFSGGTIDNGHDESKWGQRQNALLKEEISKEVEGLGGKAGRQAESEKFDNILKKYQTNRTATVNDMINDFRDKSKDPSLSETEKKFYQVLSVELAGAGLNGSTQIASIGSGVWDDIKSKFSEWFGKKDK